MSLYPPARTVILMHALWSLLCPVPGLPRIDFIGIAGLLGTVTARHACRTHYSLANQGGTSGSTAIHACRASLGHATSPRKVGGEACTIGARKTVGDALPASTTPSVAQHVQPILLLAATHSSTGGPGTQSTGSAAGFCI